VRVCEQVSVCVCACVCVCVCARAMSAIIAASISRTFVCVCGCLCVYMCVILCVRERECVIIAAPIQMSH